MTLSDEYLTTELSHTHTHTCIIMICVHTIQRRLMKIYDGQTVKTAHPLVSSEGSDIWKRPSCQTPLQVLTLTFATRLALIMSLSHSRKLPTLVVFCKSACVSISFGLNQCNQGCVTNRTVAQLTPTCRTWCAHFGSHFRSGINWYLLVAAGNQLSRCWTNLLCSRRWTYGPVRITSICTTTWVIREKRPAECCVC